MSQANELIVHGVVNAICNCELCPWNGHGNLPTHVMDLAHALLPKVSGSKASCCTLADLLTATYQLGMSRALASIAAGLEDQR